LRPFLPGLKGNLSVKWLGRLDRHDRKETTRPTKNMTDGAPMTSRRAFEAFRQNFLDATIALSGRCQGTENAKQGQSRSSLEPLLPFIQLPAAH
jgi:hypothetical protein